MHSVLHMAIDSLKKPNTEQPSWRIATYNLGNFIKCRLLPFLKWVCIYLIVSAAISIGFSIATVFIATNYTSLSLDNLPMPTEVIHDSFLVFENLPIFTEDGRPRIVTAVDLVEKNSHATEILSELLIAERVLGLLVNAILISVVTSIAMSPINPLWIAPRFILNAHRADGGCLAFKYWIKYPEDKWLHRFVLTVRILSDKADRSIEDKNETEFEDKFERIMRRGMCEYQIPLVEKTITEKGELILDVLGKLVVATFGKSSVAYPIWNSKEHRLENKTPESLRGYEDYQINFRIAGMTDDGHEVSSEIKYSIEDLLYDYEFLPAEVPFDATKSSCNPISRLLWRGNKRYRFLFGNIWKVVPVEDGQAISQHLGKDMTKIERGEDYGKKLLKYFSQLAKNINNQYRLHREENMDSITDTITFRLATENDAEAIASLSEQVQSLLPCRDFYVISTPERIREKLRINSFAYLAYAGGSLAGFYLFEKPGLNREDNPGYKIGLSKPELMKVLCMDSVAVSPAYRGLGLQRRMAKMGETEGLNRGLSIFMGTADPRNTPSVRNFILDGYDIVHVEENYFGQGIPRAVFMKRADGKKLEFKSTTDGVTLSSFPDAV